jgi:hypothetical protein
MPTIARTLATRDQSKVRIADSISSGRHFHSRYLDIAGRASAHIVGSLTGPAREYLRGYIDAKLETLWRETTFCYLVNGAWIPADELEYGPECRVTDGTCDHSGHYVAHCNPPAAHIWRGTDGTLVTDRDGGPRFFTDPQPVSQSR